MLAKNISSSSQIAKFAVWRGGTLFRAYTQANHGLIKFFLQNSKIQKKIPVITCIIIQLIYTQNIRSLSQRKAKKQPFLDFHAKLPKKQKMAALGQTVTENEIFFHHSTTLGEYFKTQYQTKFRKKKS